jgi:hypothetical protein
VIRGIAPQAHGGRQGVLRLALPVEHGVRLTHGLEGFGIVAGDVARALNGEGAGRVVVESEG